MIRKPMYFSEEQLAYLDKVSNDKVTRSEHIRRAIDEYIKKLEELKLPKVSTSPSKLVQLSESKWKLEGSSSV